MSPTSASCREFEESRLWMRNAATSSIIIYQLARQALRLPGEVAEVGVYKGGSAYLMDAIFDPDIPIHLFDTFAGMPPVDPENR